MTEVHKGSCFCGGVEVEVSGEPMAMGYCHCSSCQAWSGTPITAYSLWRSDQVRIGKGEELVGTYSKTGQTDRCFCTRCGGHLTASMPAYGITDVFPAILPTLPFKANEHVNYGESRMRICDGLPKYRDFPAEAGGSGEMVAE
jgi:hypothetical protein